LQDLVSKRKKKKENLWYCKSLRLEGWLL
jgi:hypothetical protein